MMVVTPTARQCKPCQGPVPTSTLGHPAGKASWQVCASARHAACSDEHSWPAIKWRPPPPLAVASCRTPVHGDPGACAPSAHQGLVQHRVSPETRPRPCRCQHGAVDGGAGRCLRANPLAARGRAIGQTSRRCVACCGAELMKLLPTAPCSTPHFRSLRFATGALFAASRGSCGSEYDKQSHAGMRWPPGAMDSTVRLLSSLAWCWLAAGHAPLPPRGTFAGTERTLVTPPRMCCRLWGKLSRARLRARPPLGQPQRLLELQAFRPTSRSTVQRNASSTARPWPPASKPWKVPRCGASRPWQWL